MLRRAQVAIPLILIVLLAGCFRQAEQPIERLDSSQPVSSTAAPTDPSATAADAETQPTEEPVEPTAEDAQEAQEEGDGEEPPIEITVETSTPIQPTDVEPTEAPPTEGPTEVLPTDEPQENDETEAQSDDGEEAAPDAEPTATPQIITPGAPVGPSALNTPTPEPLEPTPTTPADRATPTSPVAQGSDDCVYVVQPGDNLYRISVNNNTTVQALREANPNIIGDLIQPGDRVNLPNCGGTGGPVESAGEDDQTDVVVPEPTTPALTGPQTIHVVRSGETLFQIARQYGVSVDEITAANELVDPDRLSIGQELVIPPPS